MSRHLFLILLLLLSFSLSLFSCPCELKITQQFINADKEPIVETYRCQSLKSSLKPKIQIRKGSIIKFEFCRGPHVCDSEGVPFHEIRMSDDNLGDGSIVTPSPRRENFICVTQFGPTRITTYHYTATYTPPEEFSEDLNTVAFDFIKIDEDSNNNLFDVLLYTLTFKVAQFEVEVYSNDDVLNKTTFLDKILVSSSVDESNYEYNVVADGTETLAFHFEEGEMKIRDAQSATVSGSLKETEDGMIFRAPRSFKSNGTDIFLDYQLPDSDETDLTIKLNLKPVPVMFLHGLGSSGVIWGNATSALLGKGWDAYQITSPSYDNDASFSSIAVSISSKIETWLEELRAKDLHFNRINLVGHSMGGLVARQYANDFGTDRIQKIITLNTPHSGSELANFVMDGSFVGLGRKLGEVVFFSLEDFSIDNGAMNSLRVNSSEILSLNSNLNSNVKTHSISSVYELCDYLGPSVIATSVANKRFKVLIGTASKFLSFASYGIIGICGLHSYILSPPSDGVVRQISQSGGLTGLANQNYSGILGTSHTSTTINSSLISEHLPNLLKSDSESPLFANGFRPFKIDPPSLYEPTITETRSTGPKITIEGLENFDTIKAKLNPSIEVIGSNEISGLMIGYYFVEADSVIFDSIFSQAIDFVIPNLTNYEGELIINLIGTDGNGNFDYKGFNTFVTQQLSSAPTTPFLIEPKNNSTIDSIDQSLSWTVSSLASNYHLQVSMDESFGGYFIVDSVNFRKNKIDLKGLQPNTKYYWRVKSKNPIGESSWSDIWNFTTPTITNTEDLQPPIAIYLYPNPVKQNHIWVNVSSLSSEDIRIEIYNMTGHNIKTIKEKIIPGRNNIKLSLSDLRPGVYGVKLFSGRVNCNQIFIKY
jgi:hypothetical protein